jgi:hypothetical protein
MIFLFLTDNIECRHNVSSPFFKNEENSRNQQHKSHRIIPSKFFLQIPDAENRKNHQRNDFLYGFQFNCIEHTMPETVCRNLKAVFQKSYAPAYQYYLPQAYLFIFQVPIPGKGHEDIGNQQQDYCLHILMNITLIKTR